MSGGDVGVKLEIEPATGKPCVGALLGLPRLSAQRFQQGSVSIQGTFNFPCGPGPVMPFGRRCFHFLNLKAGWSSRL